MALQADPQPQSSDSTESFSEGQRLRQRAEAALQQLDDALEADDELPAPARADLTSTAARLRRSAASLAERHDRLADAISDRGAEGAQVAGLAARLARLDTLQRAGRPVDARERARLEAALAEHTASEAAAEEVESELVATTAQLLEIAATARRVRRELVGQGAPASADELVARLSREADAVERARREASARARQRS
jgi:hypothetical protein